MKKSLPIAILLALAIHVKAQQSDPKAHYQSAFNELQSMITGEIPTSFKRAVFITENAYLDNRLQYSDFTKPIDKLVSLVKALESADGLNYPQKDRQQVLLSASIFRALKDTITINDPNKKFVYQKLPYTYDMDDFWGEKDWTKMFVTNLLYDGTGNCHSMPALYKILADEVGVQAYLAITPNHTYIKQWNDQAGWYNIEVTSGQFPLDGVIKSNSYIKHEAIVDGVYMDTLSNKEVIAYVITDLVHGYVKKFGQGDTSTPLKWLETVLKNYPDYPNALILKAELEKKDFEKSMEAKNIKDFTKLSGEPELSQKFKELEESYFKVHQIGYRRMPKEMYLNWLYRINKDTTRKPFYFKSPQPFKDYNYNVQIVTAGDGQNYEFYDQEDVVRIGTVQINRRTGKIVKFTEYGDDEIPDDAISRMYDPALGRFWQIDPLADQYYPASPYNYTLNNPVNIIDPDGRSAEAVIDEKNKTIKVNIVIVFYGSGASQENVDAAIATINKMYNANADEDGWSDGGDGWKIQVNATGEITDEEGAKEMAEDNEGNALYSYVRVEDQNNQTSVGGDNKVSKMEEHAGNSGFWISRDMKTTTPAHEQGHGLGLSNPWHDLAEGIMVPGTNNRKVNQGNLSELRSNILEHGTDKSSLVDKYLFNVKRVNYGSTNTTIYDKDGFSKN